MIINICKNNYSEISHIYFQENINGESLGLKEYSIDISSIIDIKQNIKYNYIIYLFLTHNRRLTIMFYSIGGYVTLFFDNFINLRRQYTLDYILT